MRLIEVINKYVCSVIVRVIFLVVVQLLFQEKNLGLKYEYSMKKTKEAGNEILEPMYSWRHGAWTDCSTTCGLGSYSVYLLQSGGLQ